MITAKEASNLCRRDKEIERLIELLKKGDVSAMGELYELIGGAVYAFALSRTADRTVSEDVTQDTFVRIYKSATTYTPLGKPMAWIMQIELNVIRRGYNKAKRIEYSDELEDTSDGYDLEQHIVDNETVNRLLSSLGEDEREIVILHVVAGLKHREIASLIGMSLPTVLSKYSRAIKKMQKAAKED